VGSGFEPQAPHRTSHAPPRHHSPTERTNARTGAAAVMVAVASPPGIGVIERVQHGRDAEYRDSRRRGEAEAEVALDGGLGRAPGRAGGWPVPPGPGWPAAQGRVYGRSSRPALSSCAAGASVRERYREQTSGVRVVVA
jgi:hypothetical protein